MHARVGHPVESVTGRLQGAVRLLAVGLVIGVLGLELGLRMLDFSYYWAFSRAPDHYRGFAPLPGTDARQRIEGDARVQINRYGFRDRDWPPKPDGTYRVAILGDSFTDAVQVPLETTWWRQLQARLRRCAYQNKPVELLNFAVSGYSTAQQLETLRHHVAGHRPDEVWLGFFPGNDITDNHASLNNDLQRPHLGANKQLDYDFRASPVYRSKRSMWGTFYYDYLLSLRVTQAFVLVYDYVQLQHMLPKLENTWYWEPGIDARVYAPPRELEWQQAWDNTRTLLRMIHEESRSLGARLRVLGLSTGAQVHPDPAATIRIRERLNVPNMLYPNWQLGQFAAEDGYEFIDLAAPLGERARKHGVFYHGFKNNRGNGHWNASGHTVVSELLATALCSHEPHEDGQAERSDQ